MSWREKTFGKCWGVCGSIVRSPRELQMFFRVFYGTFFGTFFLQLIPTFLSILLCPGSPWVTLFRDATQSLTTGIAQMQISPSRRLV
jgi:hypothetical protein